MRPCRPNGCSRRRPRATRASSARHREIAPRNPAAMPALTTTMLATRRIPIRSGLNVRPNSKAQLRAAYSICAPLVCRSEHSLERMTGLASDLSVG